jgi:hypothetical protein
MKTSACCRLDWEPVLSESRTNLTRYLEHQGNISIAGSRHLRGWRHCTKQLNRGALN